MTVQSNSPVVNYTGNGVTTSFNAPANCISPPLVILTDNTIPASPAVRTLVLNSDYTLDNAGGVYTTIHMVVPPKNLVQVLTAQLNEPFTQLTHWVEGDPFPAASHEAAADHVVLLAQQLQGMIQALATPGLTIAQILAPLASTASGQGAALVGDTTGRNQHQKNSDVVNIKDLNPAVAGDGVTNDAAAFQAGINLAALAGFPVTIDLGSLHYVLNAPIAFTPYWVTFKGRHAFLDFARIQASAAGSFTIGVQYTIVSVGTTNFMAIGASANTVGTVFVATGVGTGTGTAMGAALTALAGPTSAMNSMGSYLEGVAINGPGANTTGAGLTNAGSFVTGQSYVIVSLGTTNFNAVGSHMHVVGNPIAAGAFVVGTIYTIDTAGTTNFVAIGAASNTPGIVFTATGVGSGTGTASLCVCQVGTPFLATGPGTGTGTAMLCVCDGLSVGGPLSSVADGIFRDIVISNFRTGLLVQSNTWSLRFTDVQIYNCITCVGAPASSLIGGGFSFNHCAMYNSAVGFSCSAVNADFTFHRCLFDAIGETQAYVQASQTTFLECRWESEDVIMSSTPFYINNVGNAACMRFIGGLMILNCCPQGYVFSNYLQTQQPGTVGGGLVLDGIMINCAGIPATGPNYLVTGGGDTYARNVMTNDVPYNNCAPLVSALNNIALDGGFENPNAVANVGGILDDVSINADTAAITSRLTGANILITQSAAQAHSGTHSLAMQKVAGGLAAGQLAYPIVNQGRIGLSLWYNLPVAITAGNLYIQLLWAGGMRVNASVVPYWTQQLQVPTGGLTNLSSASPTGWQNLAVKVGRAPAWATHALIVVNMGGVNPSTIYFDDVVITTM